MFRILFILSALLPLFLFICLILVNPIGLADKLAQQERYDDALNLLKIAKKNSFLSWDPRFYLTSAQIERRNKNAKQALSDLKAGLEITEKYPLLWQFKGILAEHTLVSDLRYEEALCLIETKDYEGALAALEAALKDGPDADILYQKALVCEYLGDFQAAESDLRKAIEVSIEPAKKENALHNRANYFLRQERNELAMIDLKAGLNQFKCAEAMNDLGKAYLADDQADNAIEWFSKSLDKEKTVIAFRLRALAYAKKQEWQKALDDLDRALKLEPQNEAARVDREMVIRGLQLHKENGP